MSLFILLLASLAVNSTISLIGNSIVESVQGAIDNEPTGDLWVKKTSTPEGGPIFGVAAVNGKIYAFESYMYNGARYMTSDEYDPATDTWTAKTPMKQPRINFATAVYENKIYVIGGQYDSYYPANKIVEVYDPAIDKWTYAAPMPEARVLMCANTVNGKIYVIGGTTSPTPNTTLDNGLTNTTQVYDPNTNTWSTANPIPDAICNYASTVFEGKIYLFGGLGIFTHPFTNRVMNSTNWEILVTNNTHIYDPTTDTWSFGEQLPKRAATLVACATTGEMAPKGIYLFGGAYNTDAQPFNRFNRHLQITQVYNPTANSWINGTKIPENSDFYRAVTLNDTMYVMWGCNTDQIPRVIKTPDYDAPPSMTSVSYQYIPFGYGTFEPIPTATPTPPSTPTPISFDSPFLPAVAVTTALVCIAAAWLAITRIRSRRPRTQP